MGYKHTFKRADRIGVHFRFRAEERMLEHIGTLVRLCMRVGATLGLGHTKRWYLAASSELLWHANKVPGRESGFSENRPFIGIGRKITPNISLEMGWQPSLINSAGKKADIYRQYLVTYLSIKIPYKSAKAKIPTKKLKQKPLNYLGILL